MTLVPHLLHMQSDIWVKFRWEVTGSQVLTKILRQSIHIWDLTVSTRLSMYVKKRTKGFCTRKTSNPSSGEFQDRIIDGRPLYEWVGEKVAQWGESHMGNEYSYVGAVVGATYPEMGKTLRKIMPKTFILVPGYGAQGGKGADLVHFFNEDGLGAIVNSSRGIIAAYKQEKYASFGELNYADASRQAVKDMIEDISTALNNR